MRIEHPTPPCGCFVLKRWAWRVQRRPLVFGCRPLVIRRGPLFPSPVLRSLKGSSSRNGLSLFELLTVLSILAVLTGLVIGLGRHADLISKRRQAFGELGVWHEALQRFYDNHDWGHYPTNCSGGVSNLLSCCEIAGSISNRFGETMSTPLVRTCDPWGQPYQYRVDPGDAPQSYDLYSFGPNRKDSDSDDIRFQP